MHWSSRTEMSQKLLLLRWEVSLAHEDYHNVDKLLDKSPLDGD